jgi:hypothetical protein
MKPYSDSPNSVKVTHLILQWQHLCQNQATAGTLVDICCHKTVGGVRQDSVNSLKYGADCNTGDGKSSTFPSTDNWAVVIYM